MADSLSAWQATKEMLESHRRLVASLTDDWRLAKVRLVTGLDDDREVLRHRYPVLEQEYALRALESDQLVAAVDLIEALGGRLSQFRRCETTGQASELNDEHTPFATSSGTAPV